MKEENNLTKIEAVEQMRGKRSIGRRAENNGERRMKYYLLGRTGKKLIVCMKRQFRFVLKKEHRMHLLLRRLIIKRFLIILIKSNHRVTAGLAPTGV